MTNRGASVYCSVAKKKDSKGKMHFPFGRFKGNPRGENGIPPWRPFFDRPRPFLSHVGKKWGRIRTDGRTAPIQSAVDKIEKGSYNKHRKRRCR